MPVNSTHPSYASHLNQWQRCRDAVDGSDAIKNRGGEYLPRLGEQTQDEYKAYLMRALWYGASARTIQGLTGSVMRKEPTVEAPEALEAHLADVTLTGISFSAFAKTTLEEVLKTGRYGVLVDMPKEAHELQRPYYAAYTAESIINWKSVPVNGIPELTLVVLCEHVWEPNVDDVYLLEHIEQYRVLRLREGFYEVETFRKDTASPTKDWVSQGLLQPTFRGERLTHIPFCFFGPNTITPDIEKPPILDLVDVNLSHYRLSADLKHGLHFCGLPVYFFSGMPETTTIKIGSSQALTATDPQATGMILAMDGQGLGPIGNEMKEEEQRMAVLGARLLEESKSAVESADTLTIRHSGDQSVLRSVANSVSTGLSKLLGWAALWSGVNPETAKKATAKLNTDFMDAKMTFAELEALVRTWQSGAISYETMYYNMERGEVTRPGVDWKKEKAQIEMEAPSTLPEDEQDPERKAEDDPAREPVGV